MKPRKKLNLIRKRRAIRATAKIEGTAERPRLAVHRTNRYIYAQLIDDVKGVTIVSASNAGKAAAKAKREAKAIEAARVGEAIAKKAIEKGVKTAVFDRRSYKFHGRIKSFADGARKAGLKI